MKFILKLENILDLENQLQSLDNLLIKMEYRQLKEEVAVVKTSQNNSQKPSKSFGDFIQNNTKENTQQKTI